MSDRLSFFFFCAAAFVFSLSFSSRLLATELRLSNGDRISGELIRRADGKIYFRSPLFGEIAVPEKQAVVVDTPSTPVESLAGLPPSQPATPQPNAVVSTEPPKPQWKGQIEFGYQQKSGREDSTDLTLRANAEKTAGRNNYKADGRALYGEDEDIVDSERYDASFRWRRDLSKRIFAQTLSSYMRDRIKMINHNVEQNVGAGYKLLESLRHSSNVGIGVTGQYRDAPNVSEPFTFLVEGFQDYSYKINGRLTFIQDSSIAYSPNKRSYDSSGRVVQLAEDAENYRVRFNAALQGKVTERISLNLRYEYEYDNTIVDVDARTDQRISTSIGYGF